MRTPGWRFCAALLLSAFCTAALAGCGGRAREVTKIADAYVGGFTALYEQGNRYAEQGLQLQADYAYGWAAASACAMRCAVDQLLRLKGEPPAADGADGRPGEWDAIAAMNYASPYPWYFEGLVHSAQDQGEEARACYEKALLNPAFSAEHDEALSTLLVLSAEELAQLRDSLTALEDAIFAVYAPKPAGYPREAMGFSDRYLSALARESLQANPEDCRGALRHYEAALRVNPFEGDYFAACALMHLQMEDLDRVFFYVNEGLFVDPGHEGLRRIAQVLNGGEEP
ncbi:MAG: hypothetical protein GXX99_04225 [Clostridiales bacterium]|nr:hypothetical protein [Clostridiales bacterium]